MIRGLLVYAALAAVCFGVWAAVVSVFIFYGWIGVAALAVAGVVVVEVVFGWPVDDPVWDDEATA